MIRKLFFNSRNLAIIICGIIFTAVYSDALYFNLKPIIFTLILLILSILYSGIFDRYQYLVTQKVSDVVNTVKDTYEIDTYVAAIEKAIKILKAKSKENKKYLIISKFMDEIEEFEQVLPMLVENYKRGKSYLEKNGALIESEVKAIEKKCEKAKGEAKTIYEKALNEKRLTLNEIENIKASVDETESKFEYMLSTLQKIEAYIESSELGDALNDEDAVNLNSNLEIFSETIKDTIKKMKI
jgi:hypothetical protein